MGGTLVYRNQIGVDHRFAHAGKWHERRIEGSPGETITIDGAQELKPGQMWLLRWSVPGSDAPAERRLVLGRTDTGFAVFDDRCTHRGGPLADGALICNTVQCPWHGSQFDILTGQIQAGPATRPIRTYTTQFDNGQVRLTLPND
jgi:nitrite reductase/ring-hydroxylating ferredoxin subunit